MRVMKHVQRKISNPYHESMSTPNEAFSWCYIQYWKRESVRGIDRNAFPTCSANCKYSLGHFYLGRWLKFDLMFRTDVGNKWLIFCFCRCYTCFASRLLGGFVTEHYVWSGEATENWLMSPTGLRSRLMPRGKLIQYILHTRPHLQAK